MVVRAADDSFRASDGLTLRYRVAGDGPPVVLVHSFGFDSELWVGTGVVDALHREGRSTVAIDCRGHGGSDKPIESGRYGADRMALDVEELVDHLDVAEVDLVSFSMGSFVSLQLLQTERRVRQAVVSGVGSAALQPRLFDTDGLPVAPSHEEAVTLLSQLTPHLATRLHDGRSDARALLALLRAGFSPTNKDFRSVTASVLLLAGTRDDDPTALAAVIPGAQVERIDADHAGTMDHPEFVPTILRFIGR
jgi:pimeloyl-ACP methyl ester carboxylesterase